MRCCLYLFTLLACLSVRIVFPESISAQRDDSTLVKLWNSISLQDDYEKDFRFPGLIDSLHLVLGRCDTEKLPTVLPTGWAFTQTAGGRFAVAAGVVDFATVPDRLVFFVRDLGEHPADYIFYSYITGFTGGAAPLALKLDEFDIDGLSFASVTAVSGTTTLSVLPDIATRLLIGRLVAAETDGDKVGLSERLWERISRLLAYKPLFNDPFGGFSNISVLLSPDNVLKVVTWNVEFEDGTNTFFGGIAVNRENAIKVHRLSDRYKAIKTPQVMSLNASRWYGAVYYEILVNKHKKNTYYTLLGYNPNDYFSKIRVVETLTLGTNGAPRFGEPIIEVEGKMLKRLIFEYSAKVSMMLRYDTNQGMIVMDNLAPVNSLFAGDPRHYGPDFTHNALKFEKGRWVFRSDVILTNPAP